MKIESGIPLPPKKKGAGGRPAMYPFETLEVGQSFVVPFDSERRDPVKSCRPWVSRQNRRLAPKHFEIRHDRDGARIFRTV